MLFVDSDLPFLESLTRWFEGRGHHVSTAASAENAAAFAASDDFDVVVTDLRLPGSSGLDLLRLVKSGTGRAEVLVVTGHGTIETAVEAIKLGAFDFLSKPCRLTALERRCLEAAAGRGESRRGGPPRRVSGPDGGEIVGRSAPMLDLARLIARVAASDRPVLVEGESGTGKELVAAAVHRASRRRDVAMVTVNCAALPEPLLESEFFGHEKGAFTGATGAKAGLFEAADGGTLFIDEVGELAPALQAKLLRVLEDGRFRRVGSVVERRADVRIIAATNRSLASEVAAGRFREDLYYRLNVLTLRLAPLRERVGDVPLLVEAFLGTDWHLDGDARRAVERYHWPGNVRQLKNALERAKVLGDGGVIRICDLPTEVATCLPPRPSATVGDDIKSREREHVLDVLRREGGNKSRTARALGVDRRSLYRMLERYEHDGFARSGAVTPC